MIEPLTAPIVGFSHATDFAWPLVLMQDVCKLNYGKALKSESRVPGPVPVYGSNGQTGWHSQALCTGPTVVLGRKGQGNLGVEWVEGPFWVIDTAYYVTFEERVDPRYFYYFVDFVGLNHLKDGTSNPSLSRDVFNVQPIPLPPTDVQEGISNVLSAFDDKIDLNRRMSETLEAMAQAIFRDWFVDFGPVRRKLAGETDPVAIMGGLIPDPVRAAELAALFPAAFDEAGQPQGWELATPAELAVHCKGSINPLAHPGVEFEHYSLPAFDSGQEPAINRGADIKSSKTPVPEGAVLLSKLNPEIPRIWLPNPPSGRQQIASTEFLIFQPLPGVGRGLLYCLFRDPTFRQILAGMVTGTSKSHQRISPPALMKTPFLIGSGEAFGAFGEFAEPLLQRVLSLRAENRTLAETRDYLLPRLMSGAVRVTPSNSESAAA